MFCFVVVVVFVVVVSFAEGVLRTRINMYAFNKRTKDYVQNCVDVDVSLLRPQPIVAKKLEL